MLLLEF
jgi:U4/U6.U5 tri-snRNP component SNU23